MTSRITPEAQRSIANEISAAGGREVCFVATLDPDGVAVEARAVPRGTADMVLALPGVARAGQIVLHNHPSGVLDPSPPAPLVAARLQVGGVGFGLLSSAADAPYVVVEVTPAAPEVRLDPLDGVEALGEHGPIAPILGAYEDRPS